MKKIFATIVIIGFAGCILKAQDTLYIHQNNGLITKIATNSIDSIIFYASTDTTQNDTTVIDADGNVYTTVTIGTQIWMVENLRTTKYKNGDIIPSISNNTEWANLNTPAYCWYDNDSATYSSLFGAMYNWFSVETGNLCPVGWHVPLDSEWATLIDYLGGESVAGGKLKETGTSFWLTPNEGATNETGFTALPGASRWYDGQYPSYGNRGYWWSSTESETCCAFNMFLLSETNEAIRYNNDKVGGTSVRCLKD